MIVVGCTRGKWHVRRHFWEHKGAPWHAITGRSLEALPGHMSWHSSLVSVWQYQNVLLHFEQRHELEMVARTSTACDWACSTDWLTLLHCASLHTRMEHR